MSHPTQSGSITITAADGESVEPTAGSSFTLNNGLVVVVMTQENFNAWSSGSSQLSAAVQRADGVIQTMRARIESQKRSLTRVLGKLKSARRHIEHHHQHGSAHCNYEEDEK